LKAILIFAQAKKSPQKKSKELCSNSNSSKFEIDLSFESDPKKVHSHTTVRARIHFEPPVVLCVPGVNFEVPSYTCDSRNKFLLSKIRIGHDLLEQSLLKQLGDFVVSLYHLITGSIISIIISPFFDADYYSMTSPL
jgi:hypothetical protein